MLGACCQVHQRADQLCTQNGNSVAAASVVQDSMQISRRVEDAADRQTVRLYCSREWMLAVLVLPEADRRRASSSRRRTIELRRNGETVPGAHNAVERTHDAIEISPRFRIRAENRHASRSI